MSVVYATPSVVFCYSSLSKDRDLRIPQGPLVFPHPRRDSQWTRQPHLPSPGPAGSHHRCLPMPCPIFQPCSRQWLLGSGLTITSTPPPSGCPKTNSPWRSPGCLQPHNPTTHSRARPGTCRPLLREGQQGGQSGSSTPYSQHPQLLEARKVILVDPGDVVAVEFPGGGKGRRKR